MMQLILYINISYPSSVNKREKKTCTYLSCMNEQELEINYYLLSLYSFINKQKQNCTVFIRKRLPYFKSSIYSLTITLSLKGIRNLTGNKETWKVVPVLKWNEKVMCVYLKTSNKSECYNIICNTDLGVQKKEGKL